MPEPSRSTEKITSALRAGRPFLALRHNWVGAAIFVAILGGLFGFGLLGGLDRTLMDIRFKLLSQPASGNVLIVQIDARSLREFGAWPWSRARHAEVIRRLDEAGARRIGVDIDFSSPAAEAADVSLSEALAEAKGKVVLPVFKQWSAAVGQQVTLTAPLPELAQHARLGSVNLRPAPDGLVREYERLHTWMDTFVPAFAPEVVGRSTAGTEPFLIDFGIRPDTVPRLSFSDVFAGRFDPNAVDGRFVIVGATALELGDELAVPVYSALSGPELQALAAESILSMRTIQSLPPVFALGIALVIAYVSAGWFARASYGYSFAVFSGGMVLLFAAPLLIQAYFPYDVPSGASMVALGFCFVRGLTQQIDAQSLALFKRSSEIRERRLLLQAITETSFAAVVVADETGNVRLVNETAAHYFASTPDNLAGRPLNEILRFKDVVRDSTSHWDTVIVLPGEIELDVEVVTSTITIEPTPGPFERRTMPREYLVYAFRDISERKKNEMALSRAAHQATEADRLKSEFIANMSHELRTPLNAIIGFSEVIKDQLFGEQVPKKYRDYATDIYESGKHLLAIINDLLQVSKIASGEAELDETEIDLAVTIGECLRIVRGYPGAARLTIEAHVGDDCPGLRGDRRGLKQILINLLSNAIKFTAPGGVVIVSAQRADIERGGIVLAVEDNGIGIPEDLVGEIMKPFFQVESATQREHHGTGLGLHIVRSIAAMHGGDVQVTSTFGRGTRISVWFPPERTIGFGEVISLENHQKSS